MSRVRRLRHLWLPACGLNKKKESFYFMDILKKILLLGAFGALGTLTRYGLTTLMHRFHGDSFPWGTLLVNVLGCFAAGLLWAMIEYKSCLSGETGILILVGFMGAFTTFSAFMLDTGKFVHSTNWLHALGNILLQNGIGFAMLLLGINVGRTI